MKFFKFLAFIFISLLVVAGRAEASASEGPLKHCSDSILQNYMIAIDSLVQVGEPIHSKSLKRTFFDREEGASFKECLRVGNFDTNRADRVEEAKKKLLANDSELLESLVKISERENASLLKKNQQMMDQIDKANKGLTYHSHISLEKDGVKLCIIAKDYTGSVKRERACSPKTKIESEANRLRDIHAISKYTPFKLRSIDGFDKGPSGDPAVLREFEKRLSTLCRLDQKTISTAKRKSDSLTAEQLKNNQTCGQLIYEESLAAKASRRNKAN